VSAATWRPALTPVKAPDDHDCAHDISQYSTLVRAKPDAGQRNQIKTVYLSSSSSSGTAPEFLISLTENSSCAMMPRQYSDPSTRSVLSHVRNLNHGTRQEHISNKDTPAHLPPMPDLINMRVVLRITTLKQKRSTLEGYAL